jgi:hypothetical protein
MARRGRARPAQGVCRAGLALAVTGALAAAGGTPYAGAVLGAGLLLLTGGGWMANREGKR